MDRSPVIGAGPHMRTSWARRFGVEDTIAELTTTRYRITTWLAVLTCALTPAYTVRWHVGPLPTTVLEDAILITLAAFVIELFIQGNVLIWRAPVVVPALLFLLAGAISVAVAPDHRAALGLYRAYIIEPIAFGLVLVNIVNSPSLGYLVVAGLSTGGLVAGIANSAVVLNALRHHAYDVVNTPPVVIYNTANAVALYLVPLIAVAGAIALHWTSPLRWPAAAFAAIASVFVVLSFSRGGYLALAAVVVGLALSHRRRWMLLGAGVVAGAALMLVSSIRHRVLTELDFSSGHNTLVGRFHLWSVTLQMLRDHPIFGAGLSGFATVIGPYWNPTNIDRFTYPHNLILNFWSETGLLGLASFLWILGVGLVLSWRGYHASTDLWRAINLGVLLAMVAVVVHGLVDVPYWKNDLSLEFWAILSLTLAAGVVSSRRASPRPSPGQHDRNLATSSGSAS